MCCGLSAHRVQFPRSKADPYGGAVLGGDMADSADDVDMAEHFARLREERGLSHQ